MRFGWYVHRYSKPIQHWLLQRTPELDQTTQKRMQSLALFAIAGSYPLVTIRDKPLSKKEHQSLILLGAATALCDDLTDEYEYPLDALKNLFAKGIFYNSENILEQCCYRLYKEAMDMHPHSDAFLPKLFTALDAQETSKNQQKSTLDKSTIWLISRDKGGHTNVLFANFLHHDPTIKQESFSFQAGVCLQLLDDIFDLHDDLQNAISTLVTTTDSLIAVNERFTTEAKKSIKLLKQIPGKNHRSAEEAIGFIFSRGTIAIEQYQRFCTKTKQSFPPKQYARKDLIVDMEKGANLIRNVSRRFVFSRSERTR